MGAPVQTPGRMDAPMYGAVWGTTTSGLVRKATIHAGDLVAAKSQAVARGEPASIVSVKKQPISEREFTEGSVRPVFADDAGQYVIGDDGERVYGRALPPADEPVGAAATGGRRAKMSRDHGAATFFQPILH